MFFKPENGWQHFDKDDEVVEFIAENLPLMDQDGIWEYYNFSECSSVWCSCEENATNQLQLTFDSSHDDARIKSLSIEMTNNSSHYFKQLFRLKASMKRQFRIREI